MNWQSSELSRRNSEQVLLPLFHPKVIRQGASGFCAKSGPCCQAERGALGKLQRHPHQKLGVGGGARSPAGHDWTRGTPLSSGRLNSQGVLDAHTLSPTLSLEKENTPSTPRAREGGGKSRGERHCLGQGPSAPKASHLRGGVTRRKQPLEEQLAGEEGAPGWAPCRARLRAARNTRSLGLG